MPRSVLIAAFLIASTGIAAADTVIVGGNIINQTWTTQGSPYVVQGDITVPAGAFLQINPGVVVRFVSGDNMRAGRDLDRTELTVRGSLRVEGTADNRVTLEGTSASNGIWYGIDVTNGATQARFRHAVIRHARYGLSHYDTGSALDLASTTFERSNEIGLWIVAGSVSADAVEVIRTDSMGIVVEDQASAFFGNCLVRHSGNSGVVIRSGAGRSVALTHCTVHANAQRGVIVEGPGGAAIANSIVTGPGQRYGVVRAAGTVAVTFSDVWGNSFNNYDGVNPGAGTISSNPLYVSDSDLRLTSNSPARFVSPTTDMGARPYDGVPTSGLLGVLWTSTQLDAGTHDVIGDLTVARGSVLSIMPGATVRFISGDNMRAGRDLDRTELTVRGSLRVEGTADNRVTLEGTSASNGIWYGIDVTNGATQARFRHAVIRHARYGLSHYDTGSALDLASTTFERSNEIGLWIVAGSVSADAVEVIRTDSMGIVVEDQASASFGNCLVRHSGNSGVVIRSGAGRSVALTHCTVHANAQRGVIVEGPGGAAIANSIVTGPGQRYGVVRAAGTVAVTFSDVWGNSFNNYDGVNPGAGTISSNPLYVSDSNLRLTSNSPARFVSPTTDMGARPYDGVPTSGLLGVLWTSTQLDAGTHDVIGDLTVARGSVLSIMPGATVRFISGDNMRAGRDLDRTELTVRGSLRVEGTADNRVTLEGTSASNGIWYGIDVTNGATQARFRHAIIRHARYGLSHYDTGSALDLASTTFERSNEIGLWIVAGSVSADAVEVIRTDSMGIVVEDQASASFGNCLVRHSGNSGVVIRSGAGHSVALTNCTVHANAQRGVIVEGPGGAAIANSIVTGPGQRYGVVRAAGTVAVTFSDVWGNSFNNYDGVNPGAGTISSNPLYVSDSDLRLQGSSVCIDVAAAGGPDHDIVGTTRPLDGDGIGAVASDLGAYEYVLTTHCGNGAVEPGEICDSGPLNGQYGQCNATCTGQGPRCGDGITNGPEACDDGNTANTDACLSTCVAATCGDSFVRVGVEQCDDGNTANTDACVGTCRLATCGDTFIQSGVEQCDDGNTSNTDGCVGICRLATCGDTFIRTGVEQCDDGNTSNTDACVGTCRNATCGDSFVRAGVEQCDDGNASNSDACLNTCAAASCGDTFVQIGVEQCDDGNTDNSDACVGTCHNAACGNRFVRAGVEQCDDGNTDNSDACVGTCQNATCGDRFVRAGVEDCDDGNRDNTDACVGTCQNATCGNRFVRAGVEDCDDGNASNLDACLTTCVGASCGDGHVRAGVEQCDDGNRVGTDACTNSCAEARCGDGVVHAGIEECDDGNTANVDACVAGCLAASCGDGFIRDGVELCDDGNRNDRDTCTNACSLPSCGDGVVQDREECDDGNTADTDACLHTCVEASCGDGVVRAGVEACDDGNAADGDGCSMTCELETTADAGVPDAGVPDAGAADAMTTPDAGTADATTPPDAIAPPDAGEEPPNGSCQTGRGSPLGLALLALAVLLAQRRSRQ